jgi:hypothetical protein
MKKMLYFFLLLLTVTSVRAQTKFGVMVFGRTNMPTKIKVAKELGINYVRDGIAMQNWTGSYERLDKWQDAGFKVLLNVQWGIAQKPNGTREPVPFPKDTIKYKEILSDILSKYKPELVVIENEETVEKYHSGPIEDYINELTAAIAVAHSKGLKITNGGLTNRELVVLVYNDYVERGMKKEAEDFARRCVKPALLKGSPQIQQIVSDTRKLIAAHKRLPLDYVNIHLYEPVKNVVLGTDESATTITPGAFQEIISYVEKLTGKKVISNEVGARTHAAEIVPQMMEQIQKANMDYCMWFSGDAEGGSTALHNEDGSLRPNGEAFKKYLADHRR